MATKLTGVVEVHPLGLVLNLGGLDLLPEGTVVEVLVGLDGVEGPAALVGEGEDLEGAAEN